MESLNIELEKLKNLCHEWSNTRCEKFAANSLLSKIKIFSHTFTVQYKLAQEFYYENSSSEIDISDGIEMLETYSKSKLKVKDDKYFYKGLEKVIEGLETLIFRMEHPIE